MSNNQKNYQKINKIFWKKKKVLITGHSGFTGVWLTTLLLNLNSKILGISLSKNKKIDIDRKKIFKKRLTSLYFDINSYSKLKKAVKKFNPEIIIHLAAQSLVKKSLENPMETFNTNIKGTINILEASKEAKNLRSITIFTTDKVYNNQDKRRVFKETDHLGGDDPYSSSKASKELIANSYLKTFYYKKKIGLVTIRSGNILGGGDWGENRLVPDLVRYNFENKSTSIRSLKSIRPWYHILDVLNCITKINEKVWYNYKLSGPYNIGPKKQGYTVDNILKKIKLKAPKIDKKIKFEEKKYLFLEIKKMSKVMGLNKNLDFDKSLDLTYSWYRNFYDNSDPIKLIIKDLKSYFKL